MRALSPSKQHEEQAQNILARRAKSSNNTSGKQTVDKNASVAKRKEVAEPITALTVKELRKECKAQGISFTKKDSKATLQAKLAE